MEPYKTSDKMFDYLVDNEEEANLPEVEELLVGCKIIGVEFVMEDVVPDSRAMGILLYLERPNGRRFALDCGAFEWDEKEKSYTRPASLTVYKSEFPKEVM